MKEKLKEKFNAMTSDTDSAMRCFALNESKTPEWSKKAIKVWYNIAVGIWLAIASVTFAPISFIFKLIGGFIKNNWLLLLFVAFIGAGVFALKYYMGW